MHLFLLLNDFSASESAWDCGNLHFYMVACFGIRNEDNKAFNSGDAFATPAEN